MMKKLLCTVVLILATVGFVQAQQEIDVLGNGISIIGDGTNTPIVGDDTDFGQVTTGTASVEHIFTIQNTGTTSLTVNPSFIASSSDFTITTDAVSPIVAGGSTTIGVTFTAPATLGVYSAQLVIFNDDSNENPYQINIQGESVAPAGPEIDVLGNGISIIGDGTNTPIIGDDTDYGQITTGSAIEHIFTIQNIGTSSLTVNPSFISGSSDFTITTAAVSPIGAGGSTTIGVTFSAPVALGTYVATIFISNSDSDENPYQINIQGESVAPVGPEMDVLGNAISIIGDGTNTPNVADDTDYGQVATGNAIEHIFTIQNTGTSALTVNPSFISGSSDFIITTDAVSPVAVGGTTTIGVTFNAPAVLGVYNTQLVIFNDDSDENPYQINIQGESIAIIAPEINVLGNAISIIGDGTNTPNIADDTDYGQIASGTPLEHIFTIQNTGTSPLTVNPSFIAGSSDFTITTAAVSPVSVGGTTTIGITYNSPDIGVDTATIIISNDDSDENPYQINIQGEAIPTEPEIDVLGNGISIIGDGTNIPNITDDTNFGQVDVTSGSVTHTFTIENTGVSDLNLTGVPLVDVIGANPADFTVVVVPTSPIIASGSTTFSITFDPSALGIRTAIVSIANDDSDENPYVFNIQGEGIDISVNSPFLITQYYEGAGSNKWIEIKNISAGNIINGAYSLALYTDSNTLEGTIDTTPPEQFEPITNGTASPIAPGEVILFRNAFATLPSAGNLGSGTPIIDTNVCTFDGNDVILISTTVDATCYSNRIDIMGIVEPATGVAPNWGVNKGFTKGCGTVELPSTTFDATINGSIIIVNDYIELTIEEVNTANPLSNMALGIHGLGSTTWVASWDNGFPDKTRNVIVSGTYTAANGSFESCNLIVSGSIDFTGTTTNYVEVNQDLTINGSLQLGDNATLFTVDSQASISGQITKFESSTSLVNVNDFTYWSSSVQNESIASTFSNADLTRVFEWDPTVANTIPGGGIEITGEWLEASGLMIPVKGYASEGAIAGTYPQTHNISFTGTPNNGTERLPLLYSNDGNTETDYNLVGNPYPSGIDIDAFINSSDNTYIDGTIWLWTHNTPVNTDPVNRYTSADYASYNLSGGTAACGTCPIPDNIMGSGQGFMVRAISNDPLREVVFQNPMRLRDQNTEFFRASEKSTILEKDKIWLNLESTDGGAFNQILVGFFDEATDEHDRGYDGLKNSVNWINFYSKIDTLKYGIQGLSNFNIDKKVPLGFDTFIDEALTYSISIHKIEGVLKDNDVYLVDNNLNITHDLKLADYKFDVDGKGNFTDRFTLQFTKSTLGVGDLELDGNSFVIINEESSFRLKSNTEIKRLKVYDMMGRLLIDKSPNESEFTISTHNIRKGTVLILNATFDNGAEVSKKAIKY